MTPLRATKDWDNLKAQLEDLRRVLEWETDYEKEAEVQRTMARGKRSSVT
jgi:hypothetical protein